MPVPTLVQFEQQIDAELRQSDVTRGSADWRGVADGQEESTQAEQTPETGDQAHKPTVQVDWMSLDEMVCSH